MRPKIRKIIKEEIKKTKTVSQIKLTQREKFIVNHILEGANNINESVDFKKIIDKITKLVKSKYATAAVIGALMSNPVVSSAMEKAPESVKQEVSQIMSGERGNNLKQNDSTSIFKLDFSDDFKSGDYRIKKDVMSDLEKLKKFTKGKDMSEYIIKITASESLVPNQAGFEREGSLAEKRAELLSNLVEKIVGIKPEVKTLVGDVEYDSLKDDKNDPKYTKDQFVRLEVLAKSESGEVVGFCDIDIDADKGVGVESKDYETTNKKFNGSGTLVSTTGDIPDRFVVVDSNGNIIKDTGYIATERYSSGGYFLSPKYIAKLTQVMVDNPNSMAIKGLEKGEYGVRTFNSFGELLGSMSKSKTANYNLPREVKEGVSHLKHLWGQGQREFVFYKPAVTKEHKINVNTSGETHRLKVYSPIGRTGYTVKGTCN